VWHAISYLRVGKLYVTYAKPLLRAGLFRLVRLPKHRLVWIAVGPVSQLPITYSPQSARRHEAHPRWLLLARICGGDLVHCGGAAVIRFAFALVFGFAVGVLFMDTKRDYAEQERQEQLRALVKSCPYYWVVKTDLSMDCRQLMPFMELKAPVPLQRKHRRTYLGG